MSDDIRIDKWLWAARFFKTRSLATHAVDLGRILQNEQKIKPAHGVKIGDLIEIHHADQVWQVEVLRNLEVRGSASVAQTMYRERRLVQKNARWPQREENFSQSQARR